MNTTIAVTTETMHLLKHAKEDMGAETFDDLLRKLVAAAKMPKKSLFGKFKNLKPFVREEIDRFG